MATAAVAFAGVYARFPGVNDSELQESPILIDCPTSLAASDNVQYTLPAAGDVGTPPFAMEVYTHSGGDLTSAAGATFNLQVTDTLTFSIDEKGYNSALTQAQMKQGRQSVTVALAGVTPGSATAAQIAAAINADAVASKYIFAVAGLTANAVSLFPKQPNIKFSVSGGTAQTLLQFPAGDADFNARTYTKEDPSLWTMTYAAGTRLLTITNGTGGAKNRVVALVRR